MKGKFIVFEGPDGSGKSTQMHLCVERMREMNIDLLVVREPGGTDLGEAIRDILLADRGGIEVRAELLLFMASRAQLCNKRIIPALEAGTTVICDRFLWSSLAYQGSGLEVGVDIVAEIGRFATYGITPDLYIVIDVPPEVGLGRSIEALDRIEARSAEFFRRVRKSYRKLVAEHPEISKLIDGTQEAGRVFEEVFEEVKSVLGTNKRA